ncbi:MAG: helix-turn-helix domain-containing protein, partial [Planctomycetes bacterium]|nr:helix-turn-helix domain-containing protein [Planctomycetota bacterium]
MARTLTLAEAAKEMDLSVRTLRRWVADEGAPSDRGSGSRRPYLVDPVELREWRAARQRRQRGRRARSREVEPAPPPAAPP